MSKQQLKHRAENDSHMWNLYIVGICGHNSKNLSLKKKNVGHGVHTFHNSSIQEAETQDNQNSRPV